jgi:DNA-binding SARP family transcriptional activator
LREVGFRFRLLGNLEVERDDVVVALGRSKLRTLLAILLLEANRTVPVDRIAQRLWDENASATARRTIHVHVARLRRALGESLIVTRSTGYMLQTDPCTVDVSAFHDLLRKARQESGDPVAESALLTQALGLWRGPALQDVASVFLHHTVVPRLAEERLRAVERRLELDLRLGRLAGLVGELTDLTREHPTREGLWVLLMLALCRLGRRVEALEAYRRVERHFREELGIDLSDPIQRLHREILAGRHGAGEESAAAREPLATARDCPHCGAPIAVVTVLTTPDVAQVDTAGLR